MNDGEAAGIVPAPSVRLLYTADEAAVLLRVKPRWLKRQAATRKVPFTMLAGSYRFSARHLEEIMRMHENAPERGESHTLPHRRARRQRTTDASDDGTAPLRPRPGPRRMARDLGTVVGRLPT
jgi:hypothetical protein